MVSELLLIVATVCAIVLWSTYGYSLSVPGVIDRFGAVKGWDFPQFYALGRLAQLPDRTAVASGAAIGRTATEAVSPTLASARFVPVYPPQVALLFRPFASLSYLTALACWLIISLVLYMVSSAALWRSCRSLSSHAAVTASMIVGAPIAFIVASYGQLSAIALALFTGAFCALRDDRPFVAGLALGSLVYKPQLGLAAGIIFLAAREWRLVAGAIFAATAQLAIAAWYSGVTVLRSYVDTLVHLGDDITLVQEKKHLLQSLSSFVDVLVPWPRVALLAYLALSALVLALAFRVWISDAPLAVRFPVVVLATVLISPHFYVYDLLILVPAGFLLCDGLLRAPADAYRAALSTALMLLYIAPVIGPPVAMNLRVQPTTLILVALFALVVRNGMRTADSAAPAVPVRDRR